MDLYIRTGKPIGSNTLKESGFEAISSATIRNYCSKLEEEGYLVQHHTSGGRVPTDLAYKFYARAMIDHINVEPQIDLGLHEMLFKETQAINIYLEQSLDYLSKVTGCASFLSSPIFDQDFICGIRLVSLDATRVLCVILTHFGFVHTEVIYSQVKLSGFSLRRIEEFFAQKLANLPLQELSDEERAFAERCFHEIALRNIVQIGSPQKGMIYRAGLSELLNYPECQDTNVLANALRLFEKPSLMSSLLKETLQGRSLKFWIGNDLSAYTIEGEGFALVSVPYFIHQKPVGAIAILGPSRMYYPKMFGLLSSLSRYLSESLTKSIYKFNIAWHPSQFDGDYPVKTLDHGSRMIEDMRT